VSDFVPKWEKAHRVVDVLENDVVNEVTLSMILDSM
jgi:hypothetical protein